MNESLLLLAQNENVTHWLTPVWLLSTGSALGLILVLLLLVILFVLSKVPGVNQIGENRVAYVFASLILGGVLSGLVIYFLGNSYGYDSLRRANSGSVIEPSSMLALILGVGLSLLTGFGFWKLVSKRRFDEVYSLFGEGFLSWLTIICTSLAAFAAVGLILGVFNGFGIVKFVEDPKGMLMSIGRLYVADDYTRTLTIPPSALDASGDVVEFIADDGRAPAVDSRELLGLRIFTDQELQISFEPISIALPPNRYFRVSQTIGSRPYFFTDTQMYPEGTIEKVYIANRGTNEATVTLAWGLRPRYPQVSFVVWTAVMVLGVYLTFLCLSILMPKVSAISHSTFKTEVSQPLYLLVLTLAIAFIMFSIWIPYNTLGEDIKMYKDSGLTLIRVVGIFAAIWAASKSVSEEIEGRTALTVLSKPVGRRQFILGKISGISLAMGILFILLGIWFYFWVAYKPIYDGRESGGGAEIDWILCFQEATHVLPAVVLAFMEVVLFVAISVAISTRTGILANLMICFTIYVLGHLTPIMVMSTELGGAFDTVKFFAQFISIIFPVLNHFDVQTAINTGTDVPWIYLGWSFVYTLLFGSATVLLALVLFEDRDLA
ncbi:MAG: hypothetical protein R3C03_16490 [Pirellulaceae bacterium]